MEATIPFNQMDVEKEEEIPSSEVASLPKERHIWRMPELPPFPNVCTHKLSCELLKKIKNWLKNRSLFIHRPEEEVGNDPKFGERRPSGVYQLQKSPRTNPTDLRRRKIPKPSRKQQRQSKLAQTLPTRVQGPQIAAFSHGKCLQYGQNSHGIHSQKAGKDEQDLSIRIIEEIKFFKSSIDVEIGRYDAKLNKITSDISELKRNDKTSTEWYKLGNVKFYSITNKCDRIESKFQVQEDEMRDISISHINEKLAILREQALEIINNTNQFATHLEKRDSERQKLKN
ncbi:hypothetical protein O181_092826 [Austropuccinia psidii MF-1]|uniref:Uncharacterized protein n=1 Tax=Austropuccinia psidii MF-1 TaxID=1389203 RepID=A0A9Q3J0A9_9BASI|nr:hypothetical protein [Austropuccinia psidii MF-1]